MRVFVTVGTTEFDDLIGCATEAAVAAAWRAAGVTHVVLQIGKGQQPWNIDASPRKEIEKVQYHAFRFKETLSADIAEADFVLCHGGAGTIFDCLRAKKKICVLVNSKLMGNHQIDLVSAMTMRHCLLQAEATPAAVATVVDKLVKFKPAVFPAPEPAKVSSIVLGESSL